MDKATTQITEDKLRRLKGMSYLCELPEKGWDSQKIYDRIDTTIGLGDLKGKAKFRYKLLLISFELIAIP